MANRFTDTDKWKKKWFRCLKPIHKCFWNYICDSCNHAGIWEVDFELAAVFIGAALEVDEIKEVFSKQYIELAGGKRWFIKDFVEFQYKGNLNPDNNAHYSVITILKKEGVYKLLGAKEGLKRPSAASLVKDKDKDKDKDKEKDKYLDFVLLTRKEYKTLCELFGEGQTGSLIEKLNNYIGSKGKKYKSHYFTILNWASKDGVLKQTPARKQDNHSEHIKTFVEPDKAGIQKIEDLVKQTLRKIG